MSLTYVGGLALPAVVPSVELSIGAPAIAINAELSGNLAVNASFSISPPDVAFYIDALVAVEAQLAAAIGLSLPSISFSLSDELALIASLEAALGLLVTLEGLLSASIGMYAFQYTGVASSMGAAVTSELASTWPDGAPTSANCNAMIFGGVSSVAQTQILDFMNGLVSGPGLVYTAKMSAMSQLALGTQLAIGQGLSGINYMLKAALAIQAHASLTPPALSITASAWAAYAAYLRANIALGPPKIQAALNATANAAASLSAQFSLLAALGLVLSSPGLFFCYTYSGAANAMGAALTSALASTWGDGHTSTSGVCVCPILAATDSVSYGVMTGFFGGL